MRRSMQDLVRFNRSRGLSMSQYSTLLRLHHEGDCGVSDLGEQLGVTNAAASQMVDRLVQQGLLERCEDPIDRRNKIISLSAAGRALVLESMEARLSWLNELNEALTPDQQTQIQAALDQMSEVLFRIADVRPALPTEVPEVPTSARKYPLPHLPY